MTLLWIDDIRNPYDGWAERYAPYPPDEIVWAKSYHDVTTFLTSRGCPDEVCFDHDLGEIGENEHNGFSCAKAIVEYCMDHNIDIPPYNIHSSNPVGRQNIRSLMDGWHKFHLKNDTDQCKSH